MPAYTEREANAIVLQYADNIIEDIESMLTKVLDDDTFSATAMRVVKFLNASLTMRRVIHVEDRVSWSEVKDRVPPCHHTEDEWQFVPCVQCGDLDDMEGYHG